jgi:hypothetical protein
MPRPENHSPQGSILMHALLSIFTWVFGTLRWRRLSLPRTAIIDCTFSKFSHCSIGNPQKANDFEIEAVYEISDPLTNLFCCRRVVCPVRIALKLKKLWVFIEVSEDHQTAQLKSSLCPFPYDIEGYIISAYPECSVEIDPRRSRSLYLPWMTRKLAQFPAPDSTRVRYVFDEWGTNSHSFHWPCVVKNGN